MKTPAPAVLFSINGPARRRIPARRTTDASRLKARQLLGRLRRRFPATHKDLKPWAIGESARLRQVLDDNGETVSSRIWHLANRSRDRTRDHRQDKGTAAEITGDMTVRVANFVGRTALRLLVQARVVIRAIAAALG